MLNGNTKKKYVVDIDNTICTQETNYANAKPIQSRINYINKLYDEGNTIVYFTARGTETGINWREVSENQFVTWGVKFHKLIFGKPSADYYIDDKAFEIEHLDKIIEGSET